MTVIVKITLNQKGNRLCYSPLIDRWVCMVLLLVCTNGLCCFLSFWSVFVEFHCCHYQLTPFYFINLFFVFYYLTIVITNVMLYSINSDVAVVRRPDHANYCFVYNSLMYSFFFSFCLFYSSFSDFTNSFIPLVFYSFFFSVSMDWRWVSHYFFGQLPSCLLSLIVKQIILLLDPVEI